MQAVLDAAWTHLLPAFGRSGSGSGGGSAAADAALERRLTGLRLPVPAGEAVPNAEFTVGDSVLRALVRVSLTPDSVTLHEEDGAATRLPLIAGTWPPPIGNLTACAAQSDAETLTVHVQFTQGPHKLVIVGDLRTGTFSARWRTVPLMSRSITALAAIADPMGRVSSWPARKR